MEEWIWIVILLLIAGVGWAVGSGLGSEIGFRSGRKQFHRDMYGTDPDRGKPWWKKLF